MEVPTSNNPNSSSSSSSSVRVLIRSQSSSSSSTSKTHQIPSQSSSDSPPLSTLSNGVVVVGFIGQRPDFTTHLMNRIVDANVFGSGHSDTSLCVDKEGLKTWFELRRISYFHDDQKGILFLHFSPSSCSGLASAEEEEENDFGDLRGMLFMFSVCHVIIYLQDGIRFDTQLLKKFRVLQAAKHGLLPFIRSQITAGSQSNSRPPSSSQASRPTTSATRASSASSPGKGRSILSRSGNSVSLMSGYGSYTSLFPGQCTPVMLFVYIEDFSGMPNPSSDVGETTETPTSHNQSSVGGLTRTNLPNKVSGQVVVLARPMNKSEGGFRKTLQTSLEAQIRFLIKKCRTFSGSETGHAGSRSGGITSSAPLFSLDSSRAVVLLDRSANQIGEPLEFATGLVNNVLNGKATSDSLLLESHDQAANKEDLLLVKDFIYRQSDILRGRGSLFGGSSSGSAGGAGMVAAAAAAAAAAASASVATGQTFATAELPSMGIWLTSSQLILNGLLSAKGGCLNEIEIIKRKPRPRNGVPLPSEGVGSKGADPLDVAVTWLGSGKGLNTRFSTMWCERTLPAAKEVYLKDLPDCYPTSLHEAHMDMALRAFYSLVKGPAVPQFAKKLVDECLAVWKSGRQLCDAVSLTGKPCMHLIHDLPNGEMALESGVKSHCSGYVFLHACACGRSRKLRLDPFDFESANLASDCFADCDKLLPALQLPKLADVGPVQPSSWSLIRVGSGKYYDPSKGLLQSGFCVTQKFLLKWEILIDDQKSQNGLTVATVFQGSAIKSVPEPKSESKMSTDIKGAVDLLLSSDDVHFGGENQRKPSETVVLDDKKISFGKGLPNVTMRKPFAEVVAGSAAGDSGFPPLQQKKQYAQILNASIKQSKTGPQNVEQTIDLLRSQKAGGTLNTPANLNETNTSNGFANGNPTLRIGSYVGPINHDSSEKIRWNSTFTNVAMYVGFEHECPHGHRFILNPEHLKDLGKLYQVPEESQIPSSENTSDHRPANPSKLHGSGRRGKAHQTSNRTNISASKKERHNADKSKELGRTNGYLNLDKEPNHASFGISKFEVHDYGKELRGNLDCIRVDRNGQAFAMLNRNLPLYMNCPHCRNTKNSQELPKVKFAGTVSQLQRIFLVTPPFPIVLTTCPVVQFEASCLPPSIPQHEQKLQFSLGCEVVLPPESFLALRLPFIYGVKLDDGTLHSLKPFENQPEATAWLIKGTTLQIASRPNSANQLNQ